MPQFSKKSLDRLQTCDAQLIKLFTNVIKKYDCSILYGHRNVDEQYRIFLKGRDLEGNIIDKSKVVTYCDGINKLSEHNHFPSNAVDVVKWNKTSPHIRFDDMEGHYHFGGYVMATAQKLGIKIIWGGDWDSDMDLHDQIFMDLLHFQLKEL